METQSGKFQPTPPTETIRGAESSLLMTMTGLGEAPATGRLLRGLTPYLDEQRAKHVLLLTERKRREPWSGEDTIILYQELVHWARGADGGIYRGVCCRGGGLPFDEVAARFRSDPFGLIDWAGQQAGAAVISSAEPLRLNIHFEKKPWGREGWYTGIEKRGVSGVRTASGTTDLPYALGMFPVPLTGGEKPEIILLKTLEPLPTAVLGDLYLEVHETKWETYLVLEVHPEAWPDGTGLLKAGLDEAVVARYRAERGDGWEAAVQADLLAAISRYEEVRRKIDGLAESAAADRKEPVAVPDDLREAEARLREEVDGFLGRHPVREGDLVCLPPGVLHSLQHGVKVVEFQTPTFERLIAMFAQQVVTQPHWDSERAVARMEKAPYSPSAPVPLESEGAVEREQVVDFPQFGVVRARLPAGQALSGSCDKGGAYRLLFVTAGEGRLALPDGREFPLGKEDALLLPAWMGDFAVLASPAGELTVLLADPHPAEEAPQERRK